jgi:hypothetical protein
VIDWRPVTPAVTPGVIERRPVTPAVTPGVIDWRPVTPAVPPGVIAVRTLSLALPERAGVASSAPSSCPVESSQRPERDTQRSRKKPAITNAWRSGRVVEGSGFENRRSRKGTRGSNPFSSANLRAVFLRPPSQPQEASRRKNRLLPALSEASLHGK